MIAEPLRYIGKLSKLHGFDGEAFLIFDEAYSKKITKTEWVFLTIEGLPVPFFVSDIELRSTSTAIIKLLDINNSNDMKQYIGCEVSVVYSGKDKKNSKFEISGIKGYAVIDVTTGTIGIANELLNYNDNLVMQIFNGKQEILVPVAEEIILAIDEKKKIISVQLPEGLLELYS
jgi:16S rRNA processing protein RimM